jgi:hypothetical protein
MTILGGLAWRFASLIAPIAHDTLAYWAWCSPATGIIGTHQPRHGRCTTCNRRTP